MNPLHAIRRATGILAWLAGVLLAFAAATPAALASGPGPQRHLFQPVHQPPALVPVHTAVIAGMSGWQIALIAIGAALVAATAAVLVHRAWAARRKRVTPAA